MRVKRVSNTKPKQKINRDKADAKKEKSKTKKVTDRDSHKLERRLKMRGTVGKNIIPLLGYTEILHIFLVVRTLYFSFCK